MGRIIRFSADRHQDLRDLLPWYATGQLAQDDRERVEAHLAHCPECRAEVQFERRIDQEVSEMPIDVDHSWARMREKMDNTPQDRRFQRAAGAVGRLPAWAGWAAAAAISVWTGSLMISARPQADYHVLSSPAAAATGNIAVIFRPETPERELRKALVENGGRLVDGPTVTGAFIVHVSPAGRDAALAKLRARNDVELAEAVDSGSSH